MAQRRPSGLPRISMTPEKRDKYDRVFALADRDRDGAVGLADVLAFFSKLPDSVTRSIWAQRDQFYVFLGLVTLYSKGRSATIQELIQAPASDRSTLSTLPKNVPTEELPSAAQNLAVRKMSRGPQILSQSRTRAETPSTLVRHDFGSPPTRSAPQPQQTQRRVSQTSQSQLSPLQMFQQMQQIAQHRQEWDWAVEPYEAALAELYRRSKIQPLTRQSMISRLSELHVPLVQHEAVLGGLRAGQSILREDFYCVIMFALAVAVGERLPPYRPEALSRSLSAVIAGSTTSPMASPRDGSESPTISPRLNTGSPSSPSRPIAIPRSSPTSTRPTSPPRRPAVTVPSLSGSSFTPTSTSSGYTATTSESVRTHDVNLAKSPSSFSPRFPSKSVVEPSTRPRIEKKPSLNAILTSREDEMLADYASRQTHSPESPVIQYNGVELGSSDKSASSRKMVYVKSADSLTKLPARADSAGPMSGRGPHQSGRSPQNIILNKKMWKKQSSQAATSDPVSAPASSKSSPLLSQNRALEPPSPDAVLTSSPRSDSSSTPGSPTPGRYILSSKRSAQDSSSPATSPPETHHGSAPSLRPRNQWRSSVAPQSFRGSDAPSTSLSREGYGGVVSFFKPQISPETLTGGAFDFCDPFGEDSSTLSDESFGTSTHSSRLRKRRLKNAGREFTQTRNALQKRLSVQDLSAQCVGSIVLLPGETLQHRLDGAFLKAHDPRHPVHGKIFLTNFRLVFQLDDKSKSAEDFWIALTTILDVQTTLHASRDSLPINEARIMCKDFREVVIDMHNSEHFKDLVTFLSSAHSCEIEERFCFSSKEASAQYSTPQHGHIYTAANEFKRQNIDANLWSVISNANFELSSHLAREFIVPRVLSNSQTTLAAAGRFRINQRFPTYSWGSWSDSRSFKRSVLLRAERPSFAAGEAAKTSRAAPQDASDLDVMEAVYCAVNHQIMKDANDTEDKMMLIVDVGYPNEQLVKCYDTFAEADFVCFSNADIEQRFDMLFTSLVTITNTNAVLETVERTGWCRSVQRILKVASTYARALQKGRVLIVQSGGPGYETDATLASLIELMVDPFYRTLDGFCVLVDKCWVSYGYDFVADAISSQSAIFFHFVYAVWHLTHEHPFSFEFNENFVLFLMDSLYDSRFGTFLFENERNRSKINTPLPSLWDYVTSPSVRKSYINPYYEKPASMQPSLVSSVLPRVGIWARYLFQWQWSLRHVYLQVHNDVVLIKKSTSRDSSNVSLKLHNNFSYFTDEFDTSLAFLRSLSISKNRLTNVPHAILELKDLVKLHLEENKLVMLSPAVCHLKHLTHLSLRSNDLTILPENFGDLKTLTTLRLDHNRLVSLPASLGKLVHLRNLNVSHNDLDRFPSSFAELTSLTVLDISRNRLRGLPFHIISNLKRLETLHASDNRLSVLPENFGHVTSLTDLNLSNNRLKSLPDSFAYLPKLVILNLSGNDSLEALPHSVQWTALAVLDIHASSISALPENIGICIHLRQICANGCRLLHIPSSIRMCRVLHELDLTGNRISSLNVAVGQLISLRYLLLAGNQLSELPATLSNLPKIQNISLRQNPLPPVLLEATTSELLEYLRSVARREEPANRLKLMIVGQDKVGKTSLVKVLSRKWVPLDGESMRMAEVASAVATTPYLSTDGIHISNYSFLAHEEKEKKDIFGLRLGKKKAVSRPIRLSVWDFAGQEVYVRRTSLTFLTELIAQYTTHQFFLSAAAIYLVVYDISDPNTELRIDFWLQSIKVLRSFFLAAFLYIQSRLASASMVIVATHAELLSEAAVQDRLEKLFRHLARVFGAAFKNVPIFAVSCTADTGIEQLREYLQETVLIQKSVSQLVPHSYFMLEDLLLETRRTDIHMPVISRDHLVRLGSICGISSMEEVVKCARLLSDFSTIVYFDKDPNLADLVILDPNWLTNAMATLFTTKHTWVKNGVLSHSALAQIWKEYPPSVHAALLYLLQKFEIAFVVRSQIHEDMLRTLKRSGSAGRKISLASPVVAHSTGEVKTNVFGIDETASSLVPALLPRTRPDNLEKYWPRFVDDPLLLSPAPSPSTSPRPVLANPALARLKMQSVQSERPNSVDMTAILKATVQFDRHFEFAFMPNGLFSRLLVRLLHLAGSKPPELLWANGIVSPYSLAPNTRFFVELTGREQDEARNANTRRSSTETPSVFCVQVRSATRENAIDLFQRIIDTINALLQDWPHVNVSSYSWNPVDIANHIEFPSTINVYDLREQVVQGHTEILVGSDRIDIASVAPDIALVNFSGRLIPFNDLIFNGRLGEGGYAEVFKGVYQDESVAIKRMRAPKDLSAPNKLLQFRDFRHECSLLSSLVHPGIVPLFGIVMDPLCIVMELEEASLYDFVRNLNVEMDWTLRLRIAVDLAEAVAYLHARDPPVMHRDLKSPNVLLRLNTPSRAGLSSCVKLTDFGTAIVYTEGMSLLERSVDNPVWLAPEILNNQAYGLKADTYAFGVILWEIVHRGDFFGEYAFLSDIQDLVLAGKRPSIPSHCPAEYINLLEKCWAQEAKDRPEWSMIIGELRKLQATASMIDSRFAAAEKAAVELRRRRIKEEEARVFAEKEQRQRAELRRKVAHEADLAKEEIGKQATTDAKTMDQKKLHKLIKSSAAESFSQMLHNENSRRVFDAYLAHHAGTSDDLHFYLEALEFRGQLYISKEQERKVALSIASSYLGVSENSECMLKFVGDRSLVVKVADLILAGNEISVNVFDELIADIEIGLKEKYTHFQWVLETRKKMAKTPEENSALRDFTAAISNLTFPQALAANNKEIIGEFENQLRLNRLHSLLTCRNAILSFQNDKFPTKATMSSAANAIVGRWLDSSDAAVSSALDQQMLKHVKKCISEQQISQLMFSEVLFDLECALEEVWVRLGGKTTRLRAHHNSTPNFRPHGISASASAIANVSSEIGSLGNRPVSKSKTKGFKIPFGFLKKDK